MRYIILISLTLFCFFNNLAQTRDIGIIGKDDRTLISTKNAFAEHAAIGLLLKYESLPELKKGAVSTCTATLISESFIITAAHCVTQGHAIYPAQYLRFHPAYNTSNLSTNLNLKISQKHHIYIPKKYWEIKKRCFSMTVGNEAACTSNEFDIAVIRLEKKEHNYPFYKLDYINSPTNNSINIIFAGYPIDKALQVKKSKQTGLGSYQLYSSTGQAFIKEAGSYKLRSSSPEFKYNLHLSTQADLTTGMSGSSILNNGKVIAVCSGTHVNIDSKGGKTFYADGTIASDTPLIIKRTTFNMGAIVTRSIYDEIQNWMSL